MGRCGSIIPSLWQQSTTAARKETHIATSDMVVDDERLPPICPRCSRIPLEAFYASSRKNAVKITVTVEEQRVAENYCALPVECRLIPSRLHLDNSTDAEEDDAEKTIEAALFAEHFEDRFKVRDQSLKSDEYSSSYTDGITT